MFGGGTDRGGWLRGPWVVGFPLDQCSVRLLLVFPLFVSCVSVSLFGVPTAVHTIFEGYVRVTGVGSHGVQPIV